MKRAPHPTALRSPLSLLLPALAAITAGCSSGPRTVDYARTYPALLQQVSLDVQVVRHTTTIDITNTTPRAFGPSTLWLNARFSLPIDGLAVGETRTFKLDDFRDEFSDAFHAGGFFASEPPDRLVLAQIETPRADGSMELLGFIVVNGDVE